VFFPDHYINNAKTIQKSSNARYAASVEERKIALTNEVNNIKEALKNPVADIFGEMPSTEALNQARETLKLVNQRVRWSVSSAAADPLYSTSAHEAGHVVMAQRGLLQTWEKQLVKHKVADVDIMALSEYSLTSSQECFAEIVAARATGDMALIPKNLLAAFNETIATIKKKGGI